MRGHAGFTFVELLVVVSIIAMLAALLLPAVGLVNAAARSLRCQSALRQMVVAAHGYAQDHDGLVVRSCISGGSFWWEWLAPYADASDAREESDGRIHYNSIRRTSLIWDCPAYERRTTAPLWNPPYGMNAWLMEPARDPVTSWRWGNAWYPPQNGWTGAFREFHLAGITQASRRALFGDGDTWALPPNVTARRHRGAANFAFCDGHVGQLSASVQRLAIDDPASLP